MDFKKEREKQERNKEGVWIPFEPATPEEVAAKKVAAILFCDGRGGDYRKKLQEEERVLRRANSIPLKKDLPEDLNELAMWRAAHDTIVKDWCQIYDGGEELPWTRQNFVTACTDIIAFRAKVMECMENTKVIFDADWEEVEKNSPKRSDGNSGSDRSAKDQKGGSAPSNKQN